MPPPATPPTLYILCGLPFSGKSTLGKAIADATSSTIVSFDAIYDMYATELARSRNVFAVWQAVRDLAREEIGALLRRGVSVVYDNTNFLVAHRRAAMRVAVDCGAQARVIYVDTPIATINARRKDNSAMSARGDITEVDFAYVARHFQVPGGDEKPLDFRPEMGVGAWLVRLADGAGG